MFTGRRCGNSAESQKLKEARHYLVSAKNQNYGTIVKRYFDDEQHQMRMGELGYTQSDMEKFDTMTNEQLIYVASSDERACYRDQQKVVQPNLGGATP